MPIVRLGPLRIVIRAFFAAASIEFLALEPGVALVRVIACHLPIGLGAAGSRPVESGALLFFRALGFLTILVQIDDITHDENAFRVLRRPACLFPRALGQIE